MMKRYKKKEMLEVVKALAIANDSIGSTIKANPDNVVEVLTQCQEKAILLGSYIETLGDKYACLVRSLEDYCEDIYQISNGFSDENLIKGLTKKIKRQLTQLNHAVQYDLPEDRMEVAFLPYKASMWDSLESVWKAAEADVNCDAYVIPIPYYDKNPDGSFCKEHYEGEQYPDYVPITRYEEYDFESRKPDVIFVHNPYDGGNYVTSVHPFFYSKNLKQFTEKLVYIPYFILEEADPENQVAINNMKHFCMMPGVLYADRVIVQSEDMRQVYIKVLTEATGNKLELRQYWENKIFALGSPKIDKILNTRKEDLSIPEDWLRIVQKPDRSWKKIVFYNTSIGTLLEYSELMLKKMETVFAVFKERTEDVALLWRPHPLIESTVTSMRPQLWEKYKAIRDKYIGEGWGIYDDTADMDRAVVLSDGYYGDMSSVALLYSEAGGPGIIQKVDHSELIFSDCTMIGNYMYFCPANLKVLMRYDFIHKELCFVLHLKEGQNYNIDAIASKGQKIYMLEMSGKYLLSGSIDSCSLKYLDISCGCGDYWNFAAIAEYGDLIYVFPRNAEKIVIIDSNDKITNKCDLYTELKRKNFHAPYFAWGIHDKDVMWLIGEEGGFVVQYYMVTDKYNIFSLPAISETCRNAFLYGDKIYFLGIRGKIYSWNVGIGDADLLIDLDASEDEFARIIVVAETIILLPQQGEDILLIDLKTNGIQKQDAYPQDFRYQTIEKGTKYNNYTEFNNKYYFAMQSANYLLCIDKSNGCISWEKIEARLGIEQMTSYLSIRNIIYEGLFGLPDYLNWLEGRSEVKGEEFNNSRVGAEIWEKICLVR